MSKNLFVLLLTTAFMNLLSVQTLKGQLERISISEFGTLPDGQVVKRYKLENRNGMVVKIITYGAIITDIHTPDRSGKMENVVVGSDTLARYLDNFAAAKVIGRFANRIKNAEFTLDGKKYELAANNGRHHIHGGPTNYSTRVWKPEMTLANDSLASVKLTYFSPNGEEGFPGNLKVSVTYSLNDKNELILDYEGITDQPTILNLTNHAYFDLSGKEDIPNHELFLNASHYTLIDDELIPTGAIASVKDTPLDFTKPTLIGSRTDQIKGPRPTVYDHNFIIDNGGTGLVRTAEAYYPGTGRVMEVYTTLPGVQLYTGRAQGFCLETQYFPDAINHPHFPSPVVRPDRPYASRTVFAFSVR